MIILASDTSTKSLSVAILREGNPVGSITKNTGMTHSQTHMPAVIQLLKECALDFSDIDLYACAIGPGSYTGIRIGIATTKAMAYAAGKGAVGFSTLEILAVPQQVVNRIVCPILDARSRRVFSSAYYFDQQIVDEGNRTIGDLISLLNNWMSKVPVKTATPPELVFCGDAASLYQDDPETLQQIDSWVADGLIRSVLFIPTMPEALDIAMLAYVKSQNCMDTKKIQNHGGYKKESESGSGSGSDLSWCDPFAMEANYLSPSQAERMRNQRLV